MSLRSPLLLLAALSVAPATTGCGSGSGNSAGSQSPSSTQRVTLTAGQLSLSIPKTFIERSTKRSNSSWDLPGDDGGFNINIVERSRVVGSLDEVAAKGRKAAGESGDDFQLKSVTSLQIAGFNAHQSEFLVGSPGNGRLRFQLTFVETKNFIYIFSAGVRVGRFDDYRKTFEAIYASLSVGDAKPGAAPTSASSTDGLLSVQLPPGWRAVNNLHDEATLQLNSGDSYLIAITESKRDFEVPTLAFYSNLILGNMSKSITNFRAYERKEIMIGRMPAVEVLIDGSTDGINLTYVVVLIDGSEHFYQVVGWTTRSAFQSQRSALTSLIGSIRETDKAKPKPTLSQLMPARRARVAMQVGRRVQD